MAIITAPVFIAPVGSAGSHHQVVTAPSPNFTPSHYNPVPVASPSALSSLHR